MNNTRDEINVSKMIGGNMNENKLDINDKILNIIDNQDIKLSSSKNNIRSESSIIKNLKLIHVLIIILLKMMKWIVKLKIF